MVCMTGTLKLRSILFMAISPLSLPGWWRCASCRCSCWSSCSCSAPSPGEEDVRIDVVGTDCKHGVSLRAARAAGRGQLATDAIVDVLKLGNANNSDMHERKIPARELTIPRWCKTMNGQGHAVSGQCSKCTTPDAYGGLACHMQQL